MNADATDTDAESALRELAHPNRLDVPAAVAVESAAADLVEAAYGPQARANFEGATRYDPDIEAAPAIARDWLAILERMPACAGLIGRLAAGELLREVFRLDPDYVRPGRERIDLEPMASATRVEPRG